MNMRSITDNAYCFTLAIILSFILPASSVCAEIKTFTREYTYQASDKDTIASSRAMALREAKRLLLEDLGTYLESRDEARSIKLTKDQIVTLAAVIIQPELVEEKWSAENLKYWLKARITINSGEVIKSIDSLRKERERANELDELRKKSADLLKENERLSKELNTTKVDTKQQLEQSSMRNTGNLSASETLDKGHKSVLPGNKPDAEKASGKATENNLQHAKAYNISGIAHYKNGNYQLAIKDYNKALELNPQQAEGYFNRGVCHGKLGNYRQAIKDYRRAIKLNPQYATAYNNSGVARDKLGNYRQAIDDYSRAIKLNPQYAMAYNNRSVAYDRIGNHQQAVNDSGKAIELNPQYATAYNNRGVAYSKLGNYQQAIKDYNKAIELNPQHADAYIGRGVAYLLQGNIQPGCRDAQKACALGKCTIRDYCPEIVP